MHQLEKYDNNIFLFTHKKAFVNNTDIFFQDKEEAFQFAYDMTFGGKGEHRKHRSGGRKMRTNAEIFIDVFQGKIAEYGFFNFFNKNGNSITRPDIKVEPLSKWDSFDFCVNELEIAVKSTKDYGNLLLLETKDWNKDGCYIPNIEAGHAEYDYFVLVRVKSALKEIMSEKGWLKNNFIAREMLYHETKDIDWYVNIVGFISRGELVSEVIEKKMIIDQDSKLGTIPEKTTSMDASNYYVQAGDLHEINHLLVEVNKKKREDNTVGEIDLKKLDISIEYIKRMAEGKNPINNEPLDDDSVLNNPNVIRCFYFIEDVLKQVKDADGKISGKKRKKIFPIEHLKEYSYRGDLSISHFIDQINEGLDAEQYKKLSYPKVTSWLKAMGYLDVIEDKKWNEKKSIPSEKGRAIGIYTEERESSIGRKYLAVIYNQTAQQFIIDNMKNILD